MLKIVLSALCHGANLAIGGVSSFEEPINRDEIVAVKTLKGELIGMGRAMRTSQELKTIKNGWAVKMERIIMRRDLYPKMW
jgi:H/ACA ribonucleoprotein complex subunit 4